MMRGRVRLLLALALSAGAPVWAAYPDVVGGTANLQSYWRLDDSSGLTVQDQKGSNPAVQSGVTFGVPGALQDGVDHGFGFNGSSSFVGANPSAPASVSVELWVDLNSTKSPGNFHTLFSDSSNDYSNGFTLAMDSGNHATVTFCGSGGNAVLSGSGTLPLHAWTYVAATFDNASRAAALYINGAVVATGTLAGSISYDNSNGYIMLGSRDQTTSGSFLDGALDEVALYSRALSASEIQTHYQTATSSPADAGTGGDGGSDAGSSADAGTGAASDGGAGLNGGSGTDAGTGPAISSAPLPVPLGDGGGAVQIGSAIVSHNVGCSAAEGSLTLVVLALLLATRALRKSGR